MISSQQEKRIFSSGYKWVGGIDEAGRGPLAGPVVAACVLSEKTFNFKNKKFRDLNDSKKIAEEKREEIFENLMNSDLRIGVGICSHLIIDKINILQATFLAMKKAVNALEKKPDFIFVDGKLLIPRLEIKQQAVIGGDGKIFLVAAASVIAKVTRDRIMKKMHKKFPDYNFLENKGYCTSEHMKLLEKNGPCRIHRRSFFPVSLYD